MGAKQTPTYNGYGSNLIVTRETTHQTHVKGPREEFQARLSATHVGGAGAPASETKYYGGVAKIKETSD